jgi:hypothetical protein
MNVLQIRHVLCPMDLSPVSMNALEWANAVARARTRRCSTSELASPPITPRAAGSRCSCRR